MPVETYAYDSQNRLVWYSNGTTTARYAYDALDRRIAKTVDGETTAFVYDTDDLSSSISNNIALEFDGTNLTRRWAHSQSVDEPLGFEAYTSDDTPGAGTAYEIYADRMGSITSVVDTSTGSVAAAYSYDSFGQRTQHAGSLFQFYGYTGREDDPESGLMYYRARHYDPASGTFFGTDSYGFNAGSANLYSYVQNNSFSFSDPSGHVQTKALSSPSPAQTSYLLIVTGSVAMTGVAINQIYGATITGPLDGIFDGLGIAASMMKSSGDDGSTTNDKDGGQGNCGPNGGGNDPGWWERHKAKLLKFMRAFSAAVSLGTYGADARDGEVDPTLGDMPRINVDERVKRTKDWFDLMPKEEDDDDDPDNC